MRTITKIARLELNALFFSPVAWLVLIIFMFQSGIIFSNMVQGLVQEQDISGELFFATSKIFLPPWAFFPNVLRNLYLYMPLLTMGLMSREISSGSIKLLLSSPVNISEIVLGKFLAMMIYNLLLAGILCLFLAAAGVSVEHLDYGLVVSGIIGIYLLICAYSSIGLFMSCLTSYQVVAAISTLAVLAALNFIGEVGQKYAFVRTLTYFLSLSGRAERFVGGLISTKNVFYFFTVMGLFLLLCYLKLKGGTESVKKSVKVFRYAVVIVLTLAAGYITSRPGMIGYLDMTAGKTQTISPYSQKLVAKIRDTVSITEYNNILDIYQFLGGPEKRNEDRDYWERYQRFMPGMELRYVDYYDTSRDVYLFRRNKGLDVRGVARKVSDAMEHDFSDLATPASVHSQTDLRGEDHRFVREVAVGAQKTFLRVFAEIDPQPSETEITAAFKRMLEKPGKVLFVTNHFERRIDGIGDKAYHAAIRQLDMRHSLINQGFDADTLSLASGTIPDDADVVVIADPRVAFQPGELVKLQSYIARGGNLLIAGEPGKQAILAPLLDVLGVSLSDGVVIQESKDLPPDFALTRFSPSAGEFSAQYYSGFFIDSAKIAVSGAAALSYRPDGPFAVFPVLVTNPVTTFNKLGSFAMDTGKVSFNPEHGDVRATLPVALALTRKIHDREQRVMVLGDADLMSNAEVNRWNPMVQNFYFTERVFHWFTYGKYPLDIGQTPPKDTKMRITRQEMPLLRWFFLGLAPLVLILLGTVLLVRRMRR